MKKNLIWLLQVLLGKLRNPKYSWTFVIANVDYENTIAAKDHQILDQPVFDYDA